MVIGDRLGYGIRTRGAGIGPCEGL